MDKDKQPFDSEAREYRYTCIECGSVRYQVVDIPYRVCHICTKKYQATNPQGKYSPTEKQESRIAFHKSVVDNANALKTDPQGEDKLDELLTKHITDFNIRDSGGMDDGKNIRMCNDEAKASILQHFTPNSEVEERECRARMDERLAELQASSPKTKEVEDGSAQ